MVVNFWIENGKTPDRVTRLSSAGAFRKKGGTIALYDQDEPFAHWLKGKGVGRGWRTVEVQVGKLSSIKYVVASKGFQKLTLHFLLLLLLLLFLSSFIIVLMSLSMFICMPLLSMLSCSWLNQCKLCVSMVHIDDRRAVTPLSSRLQSIWGGYEGHCCFRTLGDSQMWDTGVKTGW